MNHPQTSTDLGKRCTVTMWDGTKPVGRIVGITYEAEPKVDIQTKDGVIKNAPAERVELT